MASVEYEIQITIDKLVEEVHSAACLLMALGRERLLAVAGGYLMADDPDVADELAEVTLDELALHAVGQGIKCGELDELCDMARKALAEMTPEQQLAAARERMPSRDTRGLISADIVDGKVCVMR